MVAKAELIVCQDCIIGRHKCIVSGKVSRVGTDSPEDQNNPELVFKCKKPGCPSFLRKVYMTQDGLCPLHTCHKCGETFKDDDKVAQCLRSYKAFHYDADVENEKKTKEVSEQLQAEREKAIRMIQEEYKRVKKEFEASIMKSRGESEGAQENPDNPDEKKESESTTIAKEGGTDNQEGEQKNETEKENKKEESEDNDESQP